MPRSKLTCQTYSAAALNVTEPCNCGLGGDVFALYWNEKEKSLKGLNGSGRSPKALDLKKARELGIQGVEMSVTCPEACIQSIAYASYSLSNSAPTSAVRWEARMRK